jgi:hypothetical protein
MVNTLFVYFMVEWSGEVRNITYSADAKSVSVVYRVTLYGTDAEVCTCILFIGFHLNIENIVCVLVIEISFMHLFYSEVSFNECYGYF